jgi:hypothetical protein
VAAAEQAAALPLGRFGPVGGPCGPVAGPSGFSIGLGLGGHGLVVEEAAGAR